jgi:hypothetical protein
VHIAICLILYLQSAFVFEAYFEQEKDAKLISSPIPCEDHLRKSELFISQEELLQLKNPTKGSFSGIEDISWFIDVKTDDDELTTDCLSKVSCVSVHNTHVPLLLCHLALNKLHGASNALKKELPKVLLGYSPTDDLSLVLIMNDMIFQNFAMLDHQKIHSKKELFQLWTAFGVLVKSLLLQMANEGIVHVDIRSTCTHTYNILFRYSSSNQIELCLIDFDSLLPFQSVGAAKLKEQNSAIYWKHLAKNVATKVKWKSAYRYLFWQVLWLAYTWYPTSAVSQNVPPKEQNAKVFFYYLFAENYFVDFKNWLGKEEVEDLKNSCMAELSADKVEKALDVVTKAFGQCSTQN